MKYFIKYSHTRIEAILLSTLLCLFAFHCTESENEDLNAGILFFLAQNVGNSSSPSATNCPPSKLPSDVFLADQVVSAPGESSSRPFGNPQLAVNGVCGEGRYSGSFDVFELEDSGAGAEIIIRWSNKTVKNSPGVDIIVFENAFENLSGSTFFVEPVVVEVSRDNANYCGFRPRFQGQPPGSGTATQNRNDWQNLAGLTPIIYNMGKQNGNIAELFSDPIRQTGGNTYYMGKSGGDGFDLDDLVATGTADVSAGDCDNTVLNDIKTNGFIFLKLISARSRGFPQPSGVFQRSSDIDGVIARQVE